MRVYVLHFESRAELSRAFDRIMDDDDVGSCMIETDLVRLRFLAPADCADDLVDQIYEAGGLTWCSSHDLVSEDAE